LQREVSVIELFQYPTITALAGYLRERRPEHRAVAEGQRRAQLYREVVNQGHLAPLNGGDANE
ncbi:MAG: hypothetical protein ACHQ7M_14485, partial [Chloroflexota bacterium]